MGSDQIALPEAHFFDKMYQFLKSRIVFASPRKRRQKYRKSDISKPYPLYGESKLSPILEDQHNSSCEEAIDYQEKIVRIQEPPAEFIKEEKSPKIIKSLVRFDKSKKTINNNNRMVLSVIPEKDESSCDSWTKAEVLSPNECKLLAADLRTLLKLRQEMEKYLFSVNKVQPPENELQKVGERVMSEHELRVQRSLQRLNLPDWYRNTSVPQQGFLLGKRGSDAAAHWPGLGSKTTSLSSLGSNHSATPRSPTTGQLVSPSPTGFTRWSTSRLNSSPNSASTSPSGSARSSFNYRQPYLGWRSQERIARPRTPAERLAQGLLPLKQQQQNVPNLSEVHTSIKEVTSAIASYVSKGDDRLSPAMHRHDHPSSRSASPRGSKTQLCWLESSFVGSKPLEVPETPMTAAPPPGPVRDLHLDLTSPHRPPVLNDAL